TNQTSLSTFNNNLVEVAHIANYQPTPGVNTIPLQSSFNWDGSSNLIIDICWYCPNTFGNQNNKAQCSTTAFNSYLNAYGSTDLCGTSNAPTVSTLRPNVKFTYCIPDINNYQIAWTPNTGANAVSNAAIANPTANPVVPTNYTINVTNNGCVTSRMVLAQVDTSRVYAGPDMSFCQGTSTTLTATVIGSPIPGPASFVWKTLAGTTIGNTQSVNVSPTTTTTYVVTMNGGTCPKYDTVTLGPVGLNLTATPTNVSCFGAADGQVNVTSTNGTSPFNYTWSGNAGTGNTNPAIHLGPATYSVTVSDVNGCSGTASATVTQPTQLNTTFVSSPTHCNGGTDGSITVHTSGGTAPYTFQWSGGLGTDSIASNLAAGSYTVTVYDHNNCSTSATIPVNQPSAVVFSNVVIQNVRCLNGNTGRITVTVSGGTQPYTYQWSNGGTAATITGLTAGNYTVTVKDNNNCTATTTYAVTQPAAGITFNASTTTSTLCFGSSDGTATVNPTGGLPPYSYLWNPTGQTTQTATGLSAGNYSIVVTDDSLCTATTTLTVNQPAQIAISGTVTNVKCNGQSNGSINITIANGASPYSYAWSH
ncbi:MAG TPA: hypothetical protein VG603_01775, partial [Chitinophagales bacterium]|nr:hypothetical protein [Chitinophagales bacterium]